MLELRSHTPKGTRAREKILVAAERLFAERGFHGTSMRDVAEAAKMPLANVVYHFARKEKLYGAVLSAIGEPLAADLGAMLDAPASTDFPARLDALVGALVAWSRREPRRVRLLVRELLDNPGRVAKASKLPLAPVLVTLSAFLEEGARAGAFRPLVPEAAALHIVGMVSYFVAAQPTMKRIVGAPRAARVEGRYELEVMTAVRAMVRSARSAADGAKRA